LLRCTEVTLISFSQMKIFSSFFKAFPSFTGIILTNYIFLFAFRLRELISSAAISIPDVLNGMAGDFLLVNTIMLGFYFLYRLIWTIKPLAAHVLFTAATIAFYLMAALVQMYYAQSGQLVDVHQHNASIIQTLGFLLSKLSVVSILLSSASMITAGVLIFYLLYKRHFDLHIRTTLFILLLLLCIPISLHLWLHTGFFNQNSHRISKPLYFVKTAITSRFDSPITPTAQNQMLLQVIRKDSSKSVHSDKYPLVHQSPAKEDCLSSLFKATSNGNPPDIVILVMEGLAHDHIMPMHSLRFMPFLESLSQKSLQWNHFFCPTPQGISSLPSILGGLPPGEKGFASLGVPPYHYSLVNVLKNNGYHTSFFSGTWAGEHEGFLTRNAIDFMADPRNIDSRHEKLFTESGAHWGYSDKELYESFFNHTAFFPQRPQFNIIYSALAPFTMADHGDYIIRAGNMTASLSDDAARKALHGKEAALGSMLFTNDALESFFTQYSRKPNFNNTIFIITGSHPRAVIEPPTALKKYHVPLLIYSPLLQQPGIFENLSSHNDIYGSMLDLLHARYHINIPGYSTSLGQSLCANAQNPVFIPLVAANGNLEDIIFEKFFLSQGQQLYTIGHGLTLTPAGDEQMQQTLVQILDSFRSVNKAATFELMPDSLYFGYLDLQVDLDTVLQKLRTTGEYHKILDRLPIENTAQNIDIAFLNPRTGKNDLFLVYEIVDENDQIVSWKNQGVPSGINDFSLNISLEPQPTESPLYLMLYIWNESPSPYSFDKLRVTLYKKRNLKPIAG
jgi:phosphoglycerol transferase MdoB-like AlkP superfamily enzyme